MNQEIDLEAALRRALKPQHPPGDFERRVLARTTRRRHATTRVWMAIAAMLVAGVLILAAGIRNHELERQAEARKAGSDLALALKITRAKLHSTHRMIRRRSDGV